MAKKKTLIDTYEDKLKPHIQQGTNPSTLINRQETDKPSTLIGHQGTVKPSTHINQQGVTKPSTLIGNSPETNTSIMDMFQDKNKMSMAAIQSIVGKKATNQQPSYQSAYSKQIDTILNGIMNNSSFNYNVNADPLYNQYSEQYARQGNLAMRDTMGNAASLTGGYGNSYATTAGSQAYDSYMQQLNDKIPELQQLAYEKYQNDIANKYSQLNALQGLEQYNYGKYRDQVSDYQTDRTYNYQKDYDTKQQSNWQEQFDYGKTYDEQSQNNWQQEFDYNEQRDSVADQQYQDQFDYGKSQDTIANDQWQEQFDYGKSQDTIANDQWQNQFDYGKSQDTIANNQWQNQFDYGKQQDKQAQSNWQSEFNYGKEKDTQNRQDYLNELAASQSNAVAEESNDRIENYSNKVDQMFNAITKDAFGEETSKYTLNDIWVYINDSDLTDEEIAIIVNENYELRNYATSLLD